MIMFKTLRTHWKKSIFLSGVTGVVLYKGRNKFLEDSLMRKYCLEARRIGDSILPPSVNPLKVTVILNPASDSGKGKSKYEDICAPLLHLAGFSVSVIRTEGVGQAKEICKLLKDTDAVLIAGGDGTLLEAVTGLLRRRDDYRITLGVLPVGKNNIFAKSLFLSSKDETTVSLMARATMAFVRHSYFRSVDVFEVSNLDDEESNKIYGLCSIHLGAFRDAHERLDKYWFLYPFSKALTYVFAYTTAAKEILWNIVGSLQIEHTENKIVSSWFTKNTTQKVITHSLRTLQGIIELKIFSGNMYLKDVSLSNALHYYEGPIGCPSFYSFVSEGLNRENNVSYLLPSSLSSKSFIFTPSSEMMASEKVLSIDNESVELRGPLKISLIPTKLKFISCEETQDVNKEDKMGEINKWWRSSLSTRKKLQY